MKASYIDAFVLVIKKENIEKYKKMAQDGCNIWMKHGALAYRECIGVDLDEKHEGMESLPFPQLVQLKEDETVWFSYIEYESKNHRDEVNKKVMASWDEKGEEDPGSLEECMDVLDMKRFSMGGFHIEVGAEK